MSLRPPRNQELILAAHSQLKRKSTLTQAGCNGMGTGDIGSRAPGRAERPNHVWALDFQFDQTADGRILKLFNSVDEHTREALAIVAARSITADAAASTLEGILARRGTAPAYIRCD